MKIIDNLWFTLRSGVVIGIVVGLDEGTGARKAYIGTAAGGPGSEEGDIQHIARNGTPVQAVTLKDMLEKVTGRKWIQSPSESEKERIEKILNDFESFLNALDQEILQGAGILQYKKDLKQARQRAIEATMEAK